MEKKAIKVSVELKRKNVYIYTEQLIYMLGFALYLYLDISPWWLIVFNVVLSVVVMIFFSIKQDKIISELKKQINPKYKDNLIEISIAPSLSGSVTVIVLVVSFVFTYIFLVFSFGGSIWYYHILYLFSSMLYSFLYLINVLLVNYQKDINKIIKYNVGIESKGKTENQFVGLYPDIFKHFSHPIKAKIQLSQIDINDTQIVKIESEVKSLNNKVESYLLESIFLGGLTFSAFLSIASSERLAFDNNGNLFWQVCQHASCLTTEVMNNTFLSSKSTVYSFFTISDLFLVLMFLSLMSSTFFLLVLTLRMRYTKLYLEMDHLLRTMLVFNTKEEELSLLKLQVKPEIFDQNQQQRLNQIVKKISMAISDAEELSTELKPVVKMITTCRNIAVILFYSILIISGLYFSPYVSLAIFSIAILFISMRGIESFIKADRIRTLLSRHK